MWFVIPQLVKLDTVTKEEKTWQEDGRLPSEPVFVPYPSGEEEDDGIHELFTTSTLLYITN